MDTSSQCSKRQDNFIALTAICLLNYTIFETKGQTLQKIRGNTVETAFRKESPIISYQLLHSQKSLFLTVKVQLDYLPAFQQTITLHQSSINPHEVLMKQLICETIELEKQLKNASSKIMLLNFDGQAETIEQVLTLSGGEYLIEGTGVVTSVNYTQDHQGYEQFRFDGKMTVTIEVEQGIKQVVQHKYQVLFNTLWGYESPFFFSQALHLNHPAKVKLTIRDYSGTTATIAQSLMTITPTSQLK